MAPLDALLAAPVADLLRAQAAVDAPLNRDVRGDGGVARRGAHVPARRRRRRPARNRRSTAVRAGSAAGVPLVVGTTADEWNLFHVQARIAGALDDDGLRRKVGRFVPGDRVDDVIDAYRRARPAPTPTGCSARP